jgi:cytochrome b561
MWHPTQPLPSLASRRRNESRSATIVLVLAGLHAAAGVIHHYPWYDGALRRMLPGGIWPSTTLR